MKTIELDLLSKLRGIHSALDDGVPLDENDFAAGTIDPGELIPRLPRVSKQKDEP